MKFSICIPNYNYERFIIETIQSVLAQDVDLEVLVSDNNSTDNSVAAVEAVDDHRIRLSRNAWNVGFAGNLDKACAGATGDRMILLSSDDLAGPDALATYQELAECLNGADGRAIFASEQLVIDGDGHEIGKSGRDARLWSDAKLDSKLSSRIGVPVLRVSARNLLKRSLEHLRTPFAFASTCYPRKLYENVEGYGSGQLFNPDKAFAWKLLTVADEVLYIEKPLFSYRVHQENQAALQRQSGALKHLVDQYRATFEVAPETLAAASIAREDLERAFVKHDIVLRGFKLLAEGERHLARRSLAFGRAAYPKLMARSAKAYALRAALATGPVGTAFTRLFLDAALTRYRKGIASERSS